jgi:hypothetical protein
MKVFELPIETKAATGYTHKAIVDHTDLTETTAATSQTLTIMSLVAGDVVRAAAFKVVTSFADAADSANNTTTMTLNGAGGEVVSSTQANANGTPVLYKAHTFTAPRTATAASTVQLVAGAPASTKTLAALTAGELHVFFSVNKLANI